ncbi:MAG: hypothetical protein COU33_00840 [Candidatus Magasanikbacteria bacterium CG10_big_fil_rev_8_21_14_0_10_43_6]|uniref:DegT/DnrJ/EryC1/StrS aminotransferase family protein n=1 Tax=Candidatus Magasanikbacteria bacterium CG10_big_fil_rev_8_21_14_0_10_43_6 TaxID=1974650 RepID=A0A2M6W2C1_9BACT|nr:MAG: hypothetical protein COU33_00840 [Candidatus Magasanikbacteria bacterium CG10_big_fil_rev_8_21_14_0_10_43_6]
MTILFNYTKKYQNDVVHSSQVDIFGDIQKDVVYTFSGKSALSLVLHYLRSIGKLENKSAEIFVPQWLGYWVYMTMHKSCFPSTSLSERTRGIMVYHQWGFPQDMEYISSFCKEKELFIIEDCAHSFLSFYRGQRVGTFGKAAIFSFAKFFPSIVGGAVLVEDIQAQKYMTSRIMEEHMPALAERTLRHRMVYDIDPSEDNRVELERNYAVYDKLLKMPDVSRSIVEQEIANGAIEVRRRNYNLVKEAFGALDYAEELFSLDVIPWVIPLFFTEGVGEKVVKALRDKHIESGIYAFDINRNMIKPNFKHCVAIPCHQGVDSEMMSNMIHIIKHAI